LRRAGRTSGAARVALCCASFEASCVPNKAVASALGSFFTTHPSSFRCFTICREGREKKRKKEEIEC